MRTLKSFRAGSRWFVVATVVAALQIGALTPALAASELTGIRISPLRNGGAQLAISFGGVIPQGYHVTGTGTSQVTLILPGATPGPNLKQLAYPGVNVLQSLAIGALTNELDVTLSLSGAAPLSTSVSGSTLYVSIGPPRAPAALPTAAPFGVSPIAPGTPGETIVGTTYEVVPLKYADVSEVVGVLVEGQEIPPNDVFQPGGSIFSLPTSGSGVVSTQPNQLFSPTQSQPQSFGQRINDNIAIDRRLNAVILSGSPQRIAALKAIIEKIDVPLPSVMLECEVVELSQTAAHDLGLDFTSGPGTGIIGVKSTNQTGSGFQSGGGAQTVLNLQAELFASIAHGGGKILATPRVLAVNGTPAQILTGDALPIISTTIYPGTPTITQETVNYIAVGVDLQIQPRITGDGFVTSHIFAEVSSVTAYVPTQQGPVPQISLRQASTVATVQDGAPFVIGGLLKDEEIENMSKIPILGDLPIIGSLFRLRHDTLTRSNLYIIITPHVIARAGTNLNVPASALPKPEVPGPIPSFPPPSPQP